MKKLGFALLGLFLAGMAIVIAMSLDVVTVWLAIPCAYGAYRCFRAVGRLAPVTPTGPRPWEH
jgi:hypothetical protein